MVWVGLLLALLAADALLALAVLFFGPLAAGLIIAAVALAFSAFMVGAVWGLVSGAPYVPVSRRRAAAMVAAAGLRPDQLAMDLGSGDGRVLLAAARAGARAEGWEINPHLWLVSLVRIRLAGLGQRVKVHPWSYWREDVSRADAVFLFLISHRMAAMSAKLRRELRPGALVVSYAFRFEDWPGEEAVGDGIYLYRQPAVG